MFLRAIVADRSVGLILTIGIVLTPMCGHGVGSFPRAVVQKLSFCHIGFPFSFLPRSPPRPGSAGGSLRTLLIAMTLVAVGLGVVVYMVRK